MSMPNHEIGSNLALEGSACDPGCHSASVSTPRRTTSPPGQQLENQPVPDFNRSENDLVNGLLFDDFPSGNHSFPVQFPDHGRITRIPNAGIDVVAEKIEKGRQVGITDPFGVGLVAVVEAV